MVALDTVFQRRSDVRFRRIATDGVVLVQNAGLVIGLNEVGARVLELLGSRITVREMLERLETEFNATREQLLADLSGFLEQLVEVGIAEEARAGGHP